MPKTNRRDFLIKSAPILGVPILLPLLPGTFIAGSLSSSESRADNQSDWRYCEKCHSLFFNGYPTKGKCAAGGGHVAQGYLFQLPFGNLPETPTAQINWRFCDKCMVMFFNGFPDKGRCPGGGGHNAQGYMFRLAHDVPGGVNNQAQWRYCGKCHGMFFDGYPQKGACPAGAGHAAAGYGFVLPFVQIAAVPPAPPTNRGGFGRVASEPFSGMVAVVNRVKTPVNPAIPREVSVDLGPVIRQAWQTARTELTNGGIAFLNERNIGSGVRTSRTSINLAQNGDLYIGTDGTGFTLRYVLRSNSVETSLRIPGPSPSGTDPRFNVKFDADVTIEVDRSGLTMSASPARLKLNVGRPTGANLTGQLGIAANDLVAVLSGKDFIGDGLKAVNTGSFALNKPIDLEIGKMLGSRVGKGIAISPSFDKRSNRLDLTLEDEGQGPIVH